MSVIASERRRRIAALLSFFVLAQAFVILLAPPADAHKATGTANAVCTENGQVVINYTAKATDHGGAEHHNVTVRVQRGGERVYDSAGAFTAANGYSFSGSFNITQLRPDWLGQEVTVIIHPIGTWTNGSHGGPQQTISIKTPADCTPQEKPVTVNVSAGACRLDNNGNPVGDITVNVNPATGATVTVRNSAGDVVNTNQPLPAGTYTWTATVTSGYKLTGPSSGSVTIPDCSPTPVTVSVSAVCALNQGNNPITTITITISQPGGATVTIDGESYTSSTTVTKGGAGYNLGWDATANPGFVLTGATSGAVPLGDCDPVTIPVTVTVTAACDPQTYATTASVTISHAGRASVTLNNQTYTSTTTGIAIPAGTYNWQATVIQDANPFTNHVLATGSGSGSVQVVDCSPDPVTVNVDAGACRLDDQGNPIADVTVTVSPSGGATVVIRDANGDIVDPSQPLPAGTYTWTATANNGFVVNGAASGTFTIDDCPDPVVVVVAADACRLDDQGNPVADVTITVTPTGGATVVIRNANGDIVDPSQPLPEGTYTWTATATGGHQIVGSASGTFTVEDCPEAVTVTVSADACRLDDEGNPVADITVTITPGDGATVEIRDGNDTVVDATQPLGPGTYTWTATASGGHQIVGSTSGTFTVEDCTPTPVTVTVTAGACYLDPETGNGVGDVTVVIDPADGATVEIRNADGDVVDPSEPLAPGTYTWTATPAADHRISGEDSGEFTVEDCTPADVTVVVEAGACRLDDGEDPGERLPTAIGDPIADVTVTITPADGATVEVRNAAGELVDVSQPVSPGLYTWTATAADGFRIAGDTQGVVQVDDCSTVEPILGALGDRVWFDANRDGLQDPNHTLEPGIGGVTVELYQRIGGELVKVATTITDNAGYYLFDELEADEYQVQFVLPPQYDGWTLQHVGADDTVDSDADPVGGRSHLITLGEGQVDLSIDAGVYIMQEDEEIDDEDEDEDSDDELPRTGFETGPAAMAGLIALGMGGLMLRITRRRVNES